MSRSLRFLILNTDYPEFLGWLYSRHAGLADQPYEKQMQARIDSLFGVADFYSSNLRKLGHEAWDIHANNEFMQKAWAREHGNPMDSPTWGRRSLRATVGHCGAIASKTPLRYLKPLFRPLLRSVDGRSAWFYEILEAQIKHYKPDVLLNQDMGGITTRFLRQIKPYLGLLMGQYAATPLSGDEDFTGYDLIISSFPPTVEYFRQRGINAELNRMGFEPRVLSLLKDREKTFDVTFVGSFHSVHSSRVAFLEAVCARFAEIKIWAPAGPYLFPGSRIRKHYMGQVWGHEMYEILCSSKITLNHHGDIAPFANNMRLYEATGVGALLITDWKANLHEMFEPGKEVVAYRSPEECVELIRYYLDHDNERGAIAQAGQRRTLGSHNYFQRMEELVDIIHRYL